MQQSSIRRLKKVEYVILFLFARSGDLRLVVIIHRNTVVERRAVA